jgi:hypothetical protein
MAGSSRLSRGGISGPLSPHINGCRVLSLALVRDMPCSAGDYQQGEGS